jgi:hypothetical protein
MKEKFEVIGEISTLPEKCCGKCDHGRPKLDSVNLRSMVECFFGPPTPVLVGTPQGVQIQSLHPVLAPESDCDQFKAQTPKPSDLSQS